MALVKPWDIERVWGSHQPVLLAALHVLKPEKVVECGTGFYSTGHIINYSTKESIHIEHDPIWYKKVRECYDLPCSSTWFLKDIRANNSTGIQELPPGEFDRICEYYKGMAKTIGSCDLLFVDTFRCARVPALLHLGPISRAIILHDLEGNSPAHYEYHRADDLLNSHFWTYSYRPKGNVNGHAIAWTNLYLPYQPSLEEFNKESWFESQRLWGMDVSFESEG